MLPPIHYPRDAMDVDTHLHPHPQDSASAVRDRMAFSTILNTEESRPSLSELPLLPLPSSCSSSFSSCSSSSSSSSSPSSSFSSPPGSFPCSSPSQRHELSAFPFPSLPQTEAPSHPKPIPMPIEVDDRSNLSYGSGNLRRLSSGENSQVHNEPIILPRIKSLSPSLHLQTWKAQEPWRMQATRRLSSPTFERRNHHHQNHPHLQLSLRPRTPQTSRHQSKEMFRSAISPTSTSSSPTTSSHLHNRLRRPGPRRRLSPPTSPTGTSPIQDPNLHRHQYSHHKSVARSNKAYEQEHVHFHRYLKEDKRKSWNATLHAFNAEFGRRVGFERRETEGALSSRHYRDNFSYRNINGTLILDDAGNPIKIEAKVRGRSTPEERDIPFTLVEKHPYWAVQYDWVDPADKARARAILDGEDPVYYNSIKDGHRRAIRKVEEMEEASKNAGRFSTRKAPTVWKGNL